MSDDQKARITSIKLWPEDFERIETLQRHLQAQLPADMRARVSLGSVIRTVLASAVCAVPADPAAPPQPTLVLGSIEPEPPKIGGHPRKHPDEPAVATKARPVQGAQAQAGAGEAEDGEGAGGMSGGPAESNRAMRRKLDRRFKRRKRPPDTRAGARDPGRAGRHAAARPGPGRLSLGRGERSAVKTRTGAQSPPVAPVRNFIEAITPSHERMTRVEISTRRAPVKRHRAWIPAPLIFPESRLTRCRSRPATRHPSCGASTAPRPTGSSGWVRRPPSAAGSTRARLAAKAGCRWCRPSTDERDYELGPIGCSRGCDHGAVARWHRFKTRQPEPFQPDERERHYACRVIENRLPEASEKPNRVALACGQWCASAGLRAGNPARHRRRRRRRRSRQHPAPLPGRARRARQTEAVAMTPRRSCRAAGARETGPGGSQGPWRRQRRGRRAHRPVPVLARRDMRALKAPRYVVEG